MQYETNRSEFSEIVLVQIKKKINKNVYESLEVSMMFQLLLELIICNSTVLITDELYNNDIQLQLANDLYILSLNKLMSP